MGKRLIVKDEILINASPSTVWDILVTPKYVAQWDELPEDYPPEPMKRGSKVVWDLPNGDQSVTTVMKAEKGKELIISLYVSHWDNPPKDGEVAYTYLLEKHVNGTLLKIEIGDFGLIKNGQMYYDASLEFAENSKKVIKELAELNHNHA